MYSNNHSNIAPDIIKKAIWGVAGIVFIIVAMAFIRPWYNVWSQEMEGNCHLRAYRVESADTRVDPHALR